MVHHPGLRPGLSSCAASRLGCQRCEMHDSEACERGGIRSATRFLVRTSGLCTPRNGRVGWAKQTTAPVGLRPLHEVGCTLRRAVRQTMGLRRPTIG